MAPIFQSLDRYQKWCGERPFRYIVATDRLEEK